jgi:hypothetical protein
LALITTGDEELLQIKEDEDFRRQLAIDVVKEEFWDIYETWAQADRKGMDIDDDFNVWTPEQKQRLADLMDDPKLKEKWEANDPQDGRWASGTNIYDHSTGYWETTVYHIVDLDLESNWS